MRLTKYYYYINNSMPKLKVPREPKPPKEPKIKKKNEKLLQRSVIINFVGDAQTDEERRKFWVEMPTSF
jgi:hypothetical protein